VSIIINSDSHFCTQIGKFDKALKLLEEAAKEKKNDLQNLIESKYTHLKEVLMEKEEDLADAIIAAKKKAIKAALHASEVSSARAKEIATEVDRQVRENPWPYIGGVAAGALLIGYIMGRSK